MNRQMTLVTVLSVLCGTAISKAAEVKDLRCEYRTSPLGIDVRSPRLSWVIRSDRRGEIQTRVPGARGIESGSAGAGRRRSLG